MTVNYTYFRRDVVTSEDYRAEDWSAVVVAFNRSDRVRELAERLSPSTQCLWAIHQEYRFGPLELPVGHLVHSTGLSESEFADNLIAKLTAMLGGSLDGHRIAVDITGFMRPELVCLVLKLRLAGAEWVDFLYAEPMRYRQKGWTQFSKGNVREVRQVIGCEGVHDLNSDSDVLMIGTGYDDILMSAVAEHKPHSVKVLVLGFPSLAPDMYQENVWRVSRASEAIGASSTREEPLFAPANDPFVTASVVSDYVAQAFERNPGTNFYLAPLGTKVHVLGFALFYAMECLSQNLPVSVILPFTEGYDQKTSDGTSKVWRYRVNLQA